MRCSKVKSITKSAAARMTVAIMTRSAELCSLSHDGHVTFLVSSTNDSLQ